MTAQIILKSGRQKTNERKRRKIVHMGLLKMKSSHFSANRGITEKLRQMNLLYPPQGGSHPDNNIILFLICNIYFKLDGGWLISAFFVRDANVCRRIGRELFDIGNANQRKLNYEVAFKLWVWTGCLLRFPSCNFFFIGTFKLFLAFVKYISEILVVWKMFECPIDFL